LVFGRNIRRVQDSIGLPVTSIVNISIHCSMSMFYKLKLVRFKLLSECNTFIESAW
jgi:hypothetical protein